jgi:hypothetical protein
MDQSLKSVQNNDVAAYPINLTEIESIDALGLRDFCDGVAAGAAIAAVILCGGL